jgi:hypothetical protein
MPLSWGFGQGTAQRRRGGRVQGGGGHRICAVSCWAGEGLLWAYREGQMGQILPRCAQLGAARSHQDEPTEVHEVGSKRPSSRGTEGHVVWWIGLIFRLLPRGPAHGA